MVHGGAVQCTTSATAHQQCPKKNSATQRHNDMPKGRTFCRAETNAARTDDAGFVASVALQAGHGGVGVQTSYTDVSTYSRGTRFEFEGFEVFLRNIWPIRCG